MHGIQRNRVPIVLIWALIGVQIALGSAHIAFADVPPPGPGSGPNSSPFDRAKAVIDRHCIDCHDSAPRNLKLATEKEFVQQGWVLPGKPAESKLAYRMKF